MPQLEPEPAVPWNCLSADMIESHITRFVLIEASRRCYGHDSTHHRLHASAPCRRVSRSWVPTPATTTSNDRRGWWPGRRQQPVTSIDRTRTVWLALGVVYVVWGSTYLGIDLAVRTIPPFLMASVRFLIAGGLLYAWAIRRGDRSDRPTAPALALGRSLIARADAGDRQRRRRLGRADARHRHRVADHRVGAALDGAARPRLLRAAARPRDRGRARRRLRRRRPARRARRPGGTRTPRGDRARLQLARLGDRLALLAPRAAAAAGRSVGARCRCSPAA